MYRRDQFGIVFNTLFSIVFGVALTWFVQLTRGTLTFESFCTAVLPAFAFNFVLGTYIPLLKVGNGFASRFLKNEKHPVFYLLRMFAIVFIMTAAMSFLSMFCAMGFHSALLPAFLFSFPKTFLFAYLVACVTFPFLMKLTRSLCTKD